MKSVSFLCCIFLVVLVRDFVSEKILSTCEKDMTDIGVEWESFKNTYSKNYTNNSTNNSEEEKRKEIFKKNRCMIKNHNEAFERNKTLVMFGMGMNQFGDLEHREFLELFAIDTINQTSDCRGPEWEDVEENELSFDDVDQVDGNYCINVSKYKEHLNWTEHGAVYEVEDQGKFKGCNAVEKKIGWAYSAIDAIRSRYFISKNCTPKIELPALCLDFLLKCSTDNKNCKCGFAFYAFGLANASKGLPLNTSCNSKDIKGIYCDKNNHERSVFNVISRNQCLIVKKYQQIKSELRLRGPMPVTIRVQKPGFQFAKGGIYYEEACTNNRTHEVLLVGYGIDQQTNLTYWLVKNSLGKSWGDYGYLKVYDHETRSCSRCSCSLLDIATNPILKF